MSTVAELELELRVLKAELKIAMAGLPGAVVTGKLRAGTCPTSVDIKITYLGKDYRSVNELVTDVITGPAQRAREAEESQRRGEERAARAARLGARHAHAHA